MNNSGCFNKDKKLARQLLIFVKARNIFHFLRAIDLTIRIVNRSKNELFNVPVLAVTEIETGMF